MKPLTTTILLPLLVLILTNLLSLLNSIKIKAKTQKTIIEKGKTKVNVYMLFEYPFSCGTWFNRGKEVCTEIQQTLEKNGLNVIPSIKPYHMGEFPQSYNGEFNIYLNSHQQKTLLGTSDEKSQFYHKGLKSFAYTYFSTNDKTGERDYLAVNPEREDLVNFMLNRTFTVLKSLGNEENSNFKNYYID